MSSGGNRENEQNNFGGGGGGWHNNEDSRGSGSHSGRGNHNNYNSSTVDNSFSLANEQELANHHHNFHQQQNFRRHHVLYSSSAHIIPSTSRYHPYPSPSSSSSSSTSSSSTTPPQFFPPTHHPHSFQEPLPRPLSTCPPSLQPSSSFSSLHPPPSTSDSTPMSQLSPPIAHHNIRHSPSAPPNPREVQEAVESLHPGVVVSSHQKPGSNASTSSNHVYDTSMQSQALDLRIQPLQIDSPPRPHEFAVPASSPSSRHHRANANINNTDSSNGMPNHAFGMYTDMRVCRCGKCTKYHSCNNYHSAQTNCIENHRIRFFRSCDSCVDCRQGGNSEAIKDRHDSFGEAGASNVGLPEIFRNSINIPSSVPSEGSSPVPSQLVCNQGNCSSPAVPQLPPPLPPPPPPPTPTRSFLNPAQSCPAFTGMPDSATIKQLLEMIPPRRRSSSPCRTCTITPVPQSVVNASSLPQDFPTIPEVTRLQMLLTTNNYNNQYVENGRHENIENDRRVAGYSHSNGNNTECNLDNCQIRLVSTTSPQAPSVMIRSPQRVSTPFRIGSEQQSATSLGIMIPFQSSQSDTEARVEVEQMTLRRGSPTPPPPLEESGGSSPVSPQTAAAFAAANTLVTMTIPKKVKRSLEENSLEQVSPQPPPRTPVENTHISTTSVIRSPSHTVNGGVVVTGNSHVATAALQHQPIPLQPMRPPSMVPPPPPLINTPQMQPFSGHQQQHHSQAQELSAMQESHTNMFLQEQQRQQRAAAQQRAQQSFHHDQKEMSPIPPILRFQQSMQQQHQQFPVNPRSLSQYNPTLDIVPRNASQQKAFSKRTCGNGNTGYGETPPPPQGRILPQLQQPHSMPNHNNLSGLPHPELLYASASFQQQQQQQQQVNRFAQYPQQGCSFQQNQQQQQQQQQDYHRNSPFPMMGGQLHHHFQQHQHQQRFDSAHQSSSALNPYAAWANMNSPSNMVAGTSSRQLMINNSEIMPPRFVSGYNRGGNSSGGGGRRNQAQTFHPYHNHAHFQPRNIFNVPAQLQQLQQQQQQYQQLQRRPPPACTATSQHPGHGHYELLRAEPPSMFGAGDLEMGGFQANECLITREDVGRRESGEGRQLPSLPPATVTENVRMPRVPIAPIVPTLLGGSSSSGQENDFPAVTLNPLTPGSGSSASSTRIRGTPISVLLTTSQRNAIASASNTLGNTGTVQQPKQKLRGRGSRGGGTGSRSRGGGSRPVGRPPKQVNDGNLPNDNSKPKGRPRKRKGEQSEMTSTRGRGGKRGGWRGITLPPFDATPFAISSGPSNPQTRIMPIDSLQGAGGTITTQAIRPAESIPAVLPGNLMLNGSDTGNNDQIVPPTHRSTSLPRRRASHSGIDPAEPESAEVHQRSSSLPAVLSESTRKSRPKLQARKKKAKDDRFPLPGALPLPVELSMPPKPVVKKASKKSSKEPSSSQSQSDETAPGAFELNSAIDRIVQQFNSNNDKKAKPSNETPVNSQKFGEESQEILAPPTFRTPESPPNMISNITAVSVQHNAHQHPLLAPPPQLLPSLLNVNRGAPSLLPMPQLHARPDLIEPEPSCPLIRQFLRPTHLTHSSAITGPNQFDISLRPVTNNSLASYPNSIPPLITLTPCWEDQRRAESPFTESFQNSVLARPLYPQQDMVPFNVANEIEIQAEPCEEEEVEQPKGETVPEEDKAKEAPQEGPESQQQGPEAPTKPPGKLTSCETSEEESYDGFAALIICEEPESQNNNENNEDNQDESPDDPNKDPSPSTSHQ